MILTTLFQLILLIRFVNIPSNHRPRGRCVEPTQTEEEATKKHCEKTVRQEKQTAAEIESTNDTGDLRYPSR